MRVVHCQHCDADVSSLRAISGSVFWVDTRGSSLCPANDVIYHLPVDTVEETP